MIRVVLCGLFVVFASGVCAQQGWKLENAAAGWQGRYGHQVVAFNGRQWLISGRDSFQAVEDVWSAADAVNWQLEVPHLSWSVPSGNREGHTVAVHAGKLWILGGRNSLFYNEVWSSPDGVNWTQETANAPWSARAYHATVVFNNRIWVIGGWNQSIPQAFNDVWSSPDGVNWTQEVAAAAWSARAVCTAAVFNNRMWIFGGSDAFGWENDVWSSSDGINWVQETANAPWPGRVEHRSEVYRGRIWIFGGRAFDAVQFDYGLNDVWSSADGVNWVEETPAAPWPVRALFASAVFNGRLWIFGGANAGGTNQYTPDIWSYGLHISHDDLPDGEIHRPYNATLEAREGDGPFVWTLASGSMPAGLTLDTTPTTDTIPISGTPTEAGTFTITLQLEDSNPYTIEQTITLRINPPPPPPPPPTLDGSSTNACRAAPSQAGTSGQGTSTAVLWLAWLAALTAATITLRHRRVA